jgi:RND family efflux transporter MFP subunit
MIRGHRLTLSWTAVIVASVALLAAGAAATYLIGARPARVTKSADQKESGREPGRTPGPIGAPGSVASPSLSPGENALLPDVTIALTPEAVQRAGIRLAPVTTSDAAGRTRIPGVVQPNAYRQVVVTPLVAGRVTRVAVALGDRVRRGQTLAEVYSPELAEAQTQYVSWSAELEAAHQALRRTERLVEIGAASRQELERVRAEHTAHTTHVESARSKLRLLGMTAEQTSRLSAASGITATTKVPAPIDGVVTERTANVGINVDPSAKLFTLVDLSTVWVVGDLYERDFALVGEGTRATITTAAYPDLALRGRVSYVDPQVRSETRTAQVRVEVNNPGGRLRLGMYADLQLETPGAAGKTMLPKAAVQNVGNRQVVYVADPKQPGRFIEREVRLASGAGDHVQVITGVQPGDVVVTAGSFYVRAERERLGLRQTTGATSETSASASRTSNPAAQPPATPQTARVVVSENGFEPSKVVMRAGEPARLTFTRITEKTCATEVVFPSLNIKRPLPLNQPVTIDFTAKSGEIAFACGMDMLHGTIVVQ